MSYNYNLNNNDLLACKAKLKKQEDYLANNFYTTSSGQHKSLLDISYSANLSKRYYPRILNKVDTFVSYCLAKDLVPVFLTVTLDGFFRDLMQGDFSRYDKVKDQYKKHIPNNYRNGFYRDYLDKGNSLSPKDLYKILSHQLHNFLMSYAVKAIRKREDDYAMIRVTEPHKDGVPHFHILLYLPEQDIPAVYQAFHKAFPAPRNAKKLTYKSSSGKNKRNGEEIYPNTDLYETHGFQVKIYSPVGYILKYILKSFVNLIENKDLDYLQAWYIHNRIPRMITTHTLLAQDIYASVAPLENDWYYLTEVKTSGYLTVDRDKKYFEFDDLNGRKIIGDRGLVSIYNQGVLVAEYGKIQEIKEDYKRHRTTSNFNQHFIVKAFSDGTVSFFGEGGLVDLVIGDSNPPDDYSAALFDYLDMLPSDCNVVIEDFFSPSSPNITSMSDYRLLNYYNDFDFDVNHPSRYALAHNELIRRSIIHDEPIDINDSTGFEVICSYDLYTKEPIVTTDYYSTKELL